MKAASTEISGYSFGASSVPISRVSVADLEEIKTTAGFTSEDEVHLRLAGEILGGQATAIVEHWRNQIIARNPNLARHSRTPEGTLLPQYLQASNRRFEQWVVDTCMRPYDQDWINYQQEIAARHMISKKNVTDHVRSTSHVPFRHIVAFVAVMNQTIRPYLAATGQAGEVVERMHQAWCKSMQIQIALWAKAYADTRETDQW